MDSSKFIYVPTQAENTFVAYRFDVNRYGKYGWLEGLNDMCSRSVGQQCKLTTSKLLDIW